MRLGRISLSICALIVSACAQTSPEHRRSGSEQALVHMPGTPECFLGGSRKGDPSKEASIMKMKGSSGCAVPWHWHPAAEHIMMIGGTAQAEVKEGKPVSLEAGDFFSAPVNHIMRFACISECSLFVYTDGPFAIHYVDDNGREISPAEALKK